MERYILIGVETPSSPVSAEESLSELSELLRTAGGEEAGRVIQNLERIHPRTYVGSGKVQEIKQMLELLEADGIICDDELTPAQLSNLADELNCVVLDRTLLILDIFSLHASTREGQAQIELARLEYRLTRLRGLGKSLSRQSGGGGTSGGGVGNHTRGAGETKLELDRRYIRERISAVKEELKEIETHRDLLRTQRRKNQMSVIGLVGYTNAGKSTLFNRLSGANVLEENKLFATLDTTVRKVSLPSGREVLFTDTVGLIHKLPHGLVNAFRSTLEEVQEADLLLHVVDASHPLSELHMQVTYEELTRLKVSDRPILTLLNKQDLIEEERAVSVPYASARVLKISALDPEDVSRVLSAVDEVIMESHPALKVLIPYSEGSLLDRIHRECSIVSEEYRDEGTFLEVFPGEAMERLLLTYAIKEAQ